MQRSSGRGSSALLQGRQKLAGSQFGPVSGLQGPTLQRDREREREKEREIERKKERKKASPRAHMHKISHNTMVHEMITKMIRRGMIHVSVIVAWQQNHPLSTNSCNCSR